MKIGSDGKPIIEKTRQLLLYFVKNNAESSITSLMKLSYLSDLISVSRLKHQISTFEYKRHYFGPFDKSLYAYIENLTEEKFITAKSDYGLTGEEFSVFSINPEKSDEIVFKEIPQDEIDIVDELLTTVRGYGAKTLTEIAYKTKPMKNLNATIGGSENLGVRLNLES